MKQQKRHSKAEKGQSKKNRPERTSKEAKEKFFEENLKQALNNTSYIFFYTPFLF